MVHPVVVVEQTSWILVAAAAVGATGGLLALWAAARRLYKNTVGRRFDSYGRIARLGTGAQLSFFISVLGEPPAMRRTVVNNEFIELLPTEHPDFDPTVEGVQERHVRRSFTESTFIDRDYYVQTLCDDDDTVLAFSVTTRSNSFKPRFRALHFLSRIERRKWEQQVGQPYTPPVTIVLGRTTFADLDSPDPQHFAPPHFLISMGAHNHAYSEFKSFGNPGKYQTFVWTASDAARQGRFGNGVAVQNEVGGFDWPDPKKATGQQPDWRDMPETQRFRRETVITTYTVVSGSLWITNYPSGRFGPHENDVRTIP